MRILFDQGTPVPLRKHLPGHTVTTVYQISWNQLENGTLISAAERDDFNLLMTTDQNLKFQQNLKRRRIAIVVLLSTSWPRIQKRIAEINEAIANSGIGTYIEVEI